MDTGLVLNQRYPRFGRFGLLPGSRGEPGLLADILSSAVIFPRDPKAATVTLSNILTRFSHCVLDQYGVDGEFVVGWDQLAMRRGENYLVAARYVSG